MTTGHWLLYGAYGFTGKLLAREAIRRGHRPVLAGRSAQKLVPLAQRLELNYVALDLQDEDKLAKTVADFDLVFHAAGPFVHTSRPMVQACLAGKTHYLDITGEVTVFEANLTYDRQAQQQGMAIISGVGFDVVPTNCLATYVANQVTKPTELKIGVVALAGTSAGTTKSMLEHVSGGILTRRNGQLVSHPVGRFPQRVRFVDGERTVYPVTWGDVTTAYQSTSVENITAYLAYPPLMASVIRWIGPLSMRLFSSKIVRQAAQKLVEKIIHGPPEHTRHTARCQLWAWVANESGDEAEAWLETPEAYHYTALAGVRCVEKTLELQPQGTLTPAQAFGSEFILDIPGTRRFDQLPWTSLSNKSALDESADSLT
ncbi:MAG: saccharopine dehydrogenase NADP-binding domain-containing protein [Anaerolineae bacterium]|nr:saccharopine dehydrogenase NADP-binding domain-containing protein [Anaerolineae bacterium]